MAKVTIALHEAEARADGTAPLYLVCRHRGARAVLSLGLALRPRDWNDRSREVRKTHPDADRLNEHLRRVLHAGQAALTDLVLAPGERVSAGRIRDRVRAGLDDAGATGPGEGAGEGAPSAPSDSPASDFLAYARELVEGYRVRGQYGTWEVYRAAVEKLAAFHAREGGRPRGGLALPFGDVTPRLARRFYAHLVAPADEGGLGNGPNTALKAVHTLRSFYKRAMEEGATPYGPNPFHAVKAARVTAEKEKLSIDEVRRLAHAALDGPTDGLLRDVRDWWLFAFYAGGMRFSDVATLERRHLSEDPATGEVRAFYRMGKTKDLHGVLLVPAAVAILDRFGWRQKRGPERVFPVLDGYDLSTARSRHNAVGSRNALVNKYLRKVAARVGLVDADGAPRRVGFHLSRHSLAGYLLESGRDVHTIQRVLGHAMAKDTEGYLRGFRRSTADEAMRSIVL